MTDLPVRFDVRAPLPSLGELGHVHLIAVGGAGMSGVAALLLDRGLVVSGSDARASAVLESLRARGADVAVGHDPRHLDGVDTVVVSSAIRDDNVELAAARARGLRVLHRSQALAVLMAGSRRVAVAGASGKTTTTSMLAVALAAAGADPAFAGGGEIPQLGASARWGEGGVFVVEADESDGSFLVYRPEIAVVTNVQPDHLDFYGTVERVQEAYAAFVASVADGGLLVACHDDAGSRGLAAQATSLGRRVLTYGFDAGADLRVTSSEAVGLGSRSTMRVGGADLELVLAVPGRHNVLDAAAAYLAATAGVGLSPAAALAGLATFAGARRRFEVMGERGGVTVVDDYAHNPAKVAAVVATARSVLSRAGGGRLHVVFQPHLYSRTRDFAAEFAAALAEADTVALLDVYGAREDPMPGVSSELIGGPLRERHGSSGVTVGEPHDVVVARVAAAAAPGDLVVTVGAGDVTTLAPRILAALEAR